MNNKILPFPNCEDASAAAESSPGGRMSLRQLTPKKNMVNTWMPHSEVGTLWMMHPHFEKLAEAALAHFGMLKESDSSEPLVKMAIEEACATANLARRSERPAYATVNRAFYAKFSLGLAKASGMKVSGAPGSYRSKKYIDWNCTQDQCLLQWMEEKKIDEILVCRDGSRDLVWQHGNALAIMSKLGADPVQLAQTSEGILLNWALLRGPEYPATALNLGGEL